MKPEQPSRLHVVIGLARHNWVAVVAGLLALLIFVAGTPIWAAAPAARVNQTVPRPTATPGDNPDPTGTPRPDDDDDEEESGGRDTSAPVEPDDPTVGLFATPTPVVDLGLSGVVSAPAINVLALPDPDAELLGSAYLNQTVKIFSRNEENTWWFICCASGTQINGWVNARLIAPNFDAAQSASLIPVDGSLSRTATTAEADAKTASTTVAVGETVLEVLIDQNPPFVWQGQQFEIHYLIVNPGEAEAIRVELGNEAPAGLEWVDARAAGGGEIRREPGNGGAALLVVSWPTLGAQESISATFTAQVAADIDYGAVIRNLVVASAKNAADASASFRIGMPPAQLPDFK